MFPDTRTSALEGAAAAAGRFRLGDRDVARLGFGAMQLARCSDAPAEAAAVLRRAVDLGVDHIDTAHFYGGAGFVNRVIADTLGRTPDIVIATKVGADPDPGAPIPIRPAQRPEQLRASVEANLRGLGVERLALVNLRRLDVRPGLSASGDQVVDLDDQLATLIALRDAGKIGAIGLSAVDLDGLRRALPVGIACVQNAYSLLSREFESMLALCQTNHVAWVPFFPLGGAQTHFAGWPRLADRPEVVEAAAALDVTPSRLGLAWLLAHRPNVLLIPGTASLDHLEDNVAAAALAPKLDAELMARLGALHADVGGDANPVAARGERGAQ